MSEYVSDRDVGHGYFWENEESEQHSTKKPDTSLLLRATPSFLIIANALGQSKHTSYLVLNSSHIDLYVKWIVLMNMMENIL